MPDTQPLHLPPNLTPELRGLLDALPHPAILLGLDYRILAANRDYLDRYGADAPVTGRHCYAVSHHYRVPCDQAGESCPLRTSRDSGAASRVLHIHHTPRGEEYVNVEMWPVHDPDSGAVRFFVELMQPSLAADTRSGDSDRLVGRSPAFRAMLGMVERVAGTDTSVLLLGESGTGKEVVARTLHQLSGRSAGPFVPVECTGMPEALFESELFGHVKGAFTGASRDKPGLVEAAAGGTLFLDEVGDIPLADQVKLLRLLESRRYRRVGSTDWQASDFRLVAATHRDLQAMVAAGTFREDLYYRLCVFDIQLPPLRERGEDLPLVADAVLRRLDIGQPPRLGDDALAALRDYPFPGNIRELRNILERAALLTDSGVIQVHHLPDRCQGIAHATGPGAPALSLATGLLAPGAPLRPIADVEADYLRLALARHDGDRRSLAKVLGLSERALYRRLAGLRDVATNQPATADPRTDEAT